MLSVIGHVFFILDVIWMVNKIFEWMSISIFADYYRLYYQLYKIGKIA